MIVSGLFGIVLIVLVVAVVAVVRRGARGGPGGHTASAPGQGGEGRLVRRFFQYLVLFGLLVVSAIGVSGLLGSALNTFTLLAATGGALALSVAFTVVGVPLLFVLALWTRRRMAADPGETRSFAWAAYVTLAGITSLSVALAAAIDVARWILGQQAYDGDSLARFIVWGAVWGGMWWLEPKVTPTGNSRVHHLIGSLIGLVTAAVGLIRLLGGAAAVAFGLTGDVLFVRSADPVRDGFAVLVVGAPIWIVYWLRTASRTPRDLFWLGYVLLAGVGGGLVVAVVAASNVVYDVLVWLVGQPTATSAIRHFASTPNALGTALVGALIWWYHHAVLQQAGAVASARTEVRRVYEYLMAAIGLVAAAAGLTMVLVALVETLSGTSALLAGRGAVNTLLAALTMLGVGAPVWVLFWRRTQRAVQAEPREAWVEERQSPTRRTYLFLLFGVVGVAAIVALLVGVYMLFEDVFAGSFGGETIRRMRFAVGVLLTTGAVAWYHWVVYRTDQAQLEAAGVAGGVSGGRRGPSYVLLLGPSDHDLTEAVARGTGGRVESWARADVQATDWTPEQVLAAVGATEADEVVVVADGAGLHVVPVHRHA